MPRPTRASTLRQCSSRPRLLVAAACVLACLAALPATAGARTSPVLRSDRVLAFGSGYDSPHGSPLVRRLQRELARAGDLPGPIDGRYGPLTRGAVERFQGDRGLIVDGITGRQTVGALVHPELLPGAGYATGGSPQVRLLQRRLAAAHAGPGPIDGLYGPRTARAVRRWQRAHGMPSTGVADARTLALLARHPAPRAPRPGLPTRPRPRRRPHSRPHSRPHAPRPSTRTTPPARTAPVTRRTSGAPELLLAFMAIVVLLLGLVAIRGHRRRPSPHHAPARTPPPPRPPDPTPAEPSPAVGDQAAQFFAMAVQSHARGDVRRATKEYRDADACGHPEAPANLGVILQNQGDLAGAEDAFRRADARGSMYGAYNLGVLLERSQRIFSAMRAYARAAAWGHGAAASNLGVLLERGGDTAAAEHAYRRADDLGDGGGALNLGLLLEERGDHAGALGAYARASQRGSASVASAAREAHEALRAREFPSGVRRTKESGDAT